MGEAEQLKAHNKGYNLGFVAGLKEALGLAEQAAHEPDGHSAQYLIASLIAELEGE